jgi:TolB-like protein/Flp pilus assembly protein TadD
MDKDTRQLAAIMLTDIVGYTALTQADEALTLALLDEHSSLLRRLFAEHAGREIKCTGDGFLVEFSSALQAVRCAVEIQRGLHERNGAVPIEQAIRVRIGIHLGDIVRRGNDIFGDSVNIAARIEPLAEPGGICLSRQVYDAVWNKVDLRMASLGKRELKNLKVPVEVYEMELPWAREAGASRQRADLSRLVVLPLVSMSPDPNDAYFADGLTEEMIFSLSKVGELQIIALTSAMKYRGAQKSVSEIGNELGVGAVLEGSVRKAGNRLRITIQLIDAMREAHIWSEVYERALDDVFAIQIEIAQSVASALQIRLAPRSTARTEPPQADPDAYAAYLKGRVFFSRRTADNLHGAVRCFERAIELDPSRAEFYAALSMAYSVFFNYAAPPCDDWHARAASNALKALGLDPSLAQAHAAQGLVLLYDYDWLGAEQAYRRAIELSSSYATAYHWLGLLLVTLGRSDEAVATLKTALKLDPLSAAQHGALGQAYVFAGQAELALEELEVASALGDDNRVQRLHRGLAYLLQGRVDLARADFQKARELGESFDPEDEFWIAYLEENAGTRGALESALQMALEHAREEHVPSYALAAFYFALGRTDKGLELLEHAYAAHEPELTEVAADPRFRSCRSDPRFAAFLMKIGLTG